MNHYSTKPEVLADPPPVGTDRLMLTSMALRQVGQLDALQQITLAVARSADVEADLPALEREIRDRLGLRAVRIRMEAGARSGIADPPAAPHDQGDDGGTVHRFSKSRSTVQLPIFAGKAPAGTLEVETWEGEDVDSESLDLLTRVASVIGTGIQRTRRQHASSRLAVPEQVAGALLDVVARLAAFPGINADMQSILDDVITTFGFSGIRVMFHDEDELLYLASPPAAHGVDSLEAARLLASAEVRKVMERQEQLLVQAPPGELLHWSASDSTAQALITPIRAGKVAVGVVILEVDGERAVDQIDRTVARELARHLGLLVQRERRIERYSRQNLLLSLVERVSALIARSVSADDLLTRIAREIRRTFGYNCSIGMISNGRLYFPDLELAGQVETPAWALEGIPLSLGVTGRVARTGEPAFIRNVEDEPVFIDIGAGTTSEICVPVRVEGEVVGVLNVESGPGEVLDDLDFDVISMVASHLGIALYNQRLISSERERRREIEAIQQVSTIIAETLDPDEAMRRIADTLFERLDYPFVSLATLEGDALVLRAVRGYDPDLAPSAIPVSQGAPFAPGNPSSSRTSARTLITSPPGSTSPAKCACQSIVLARLSVFSTYRGPLTGR